MRHREGRSRVGRRRMAGSKVTGAFGGELLMSTETAELARRRLDGMRRCVAEEDGGQRKTSERPSQKDTEEPRMSHMVSLNM